MNPLNSGSGCGLGRSIVAIWIRSKCFLLAQSPPVSSFKDYSPCVSAVEGHPTQLDIERRLGGSHHS